MRARPTTQVGRLGQLARLNVQGSAAQKLTERKLHFQLTRVAARDLAFAGGKVNVLIVRCRDASGTDRATGQVTLQVLQHLFGTGVTRWRRLNMGHPTLATQVFDKGTPVVVISQLCELATQLEHTFLTQTP